MAVGLTIWDVQKNGNMHEEDGDCANLKGEFGG